MNPEEKFINKLYEYHKEHFKVIIKGEFRIISENTEFIEDFEIEDTYTYLAIKKLSKLIFSKIIEKSLELIKELKEDLEKK